MIPTRETLAYIATLQWFFRRNRACISPSKSVEERRVSLDVRNRFAMRTLCCHPSLHLSKAWAEEVSIRQPFKARTTEELIALLSAVATAILAVIIIMMLYFGREI